MPSGATDLSYCGREVRKYDNDRFLLSLFAPADRREALWALHAFNLEIAKTREVVSEAALGRIRLQWWREAVDEVFEGRARRHEVLDALAVAVPRFGLAREPFEALVEARERDLDAEGPQTLEETAAYAEATNAPLLRLGLRVLSADGDAADAAAGHAGAAYGLAGVLRAVPFHARDRRLVLPYALLRAEGVAAQQLFDLRPPPELARVVEAVAAEARRRIAAARALKPDLPREARPLMLQVRLAQLHLDALARAGHDPFAPRVQMPHPFRQLVLAWAAATGRW